MRTCYRTLNTSFRILSTMSLLVVFVWACSLPAGRPTVPMTTKEQTLVSEALEKNADLVHIGLAPGTSIFVETTGFTQDHPYVGHVIEGWLGRQGLTICGAKEEATHRVRVIVESIGPSRNTKIFGIPGGTANTGLIGLRLPEIALYKKAVTKGYIRFYLDVYETSSGKHVRTTEQYSKSVSYRDYTLFFFFTWQKTSVEDFPD